MRHIHDVDDMSSGSEHNVLFVSLPSGGRPVTLRRLPPIVPVDVIYDQLELHSGVPEGVYTLCMIGGQHPVDGGEVLEFHDKRFPSGTLVQMVIKVQYREMYDVITKKNTQRLKQFLLSCGPTHSREKSKIEATGSDDDLNSSKSMEKGNLQIGGLESGVSGCSSSEGVGLYKDSASLVVFAGVFMACYTDYLAGVKLILSHDKSLVHFATRFGRTALHGCAMCDNMITARMVISFGADIDRADMNGCTPIDTAEQHGAVRVARFLRQQRRAVLMEQVDWTPAYPARKPRPHGRATRYHSAPLPSPNREADTSHPTSRHASNEHETTDDGVDPVDMLAMEYDNLSVDQVQIKNNEIRQWTSSVQKKRRCVSAPLKPAESAYHQSCHEPSNFVVRTEQDNSYPTAVRYQALSRPQYDVVIPLPDQSGHLSESHDLFSNQSYKTLGSRDKSKHQSERSNIGSSEKGRHRRSYTYTNGCNPTSNHTSRAHRSYDVNLSRGNVKQTKGGSNGARERRVYYKTKYHRMMEEAEEYPIRPPNADSRFRFWKTWLQEKAEAETRNGDEEVERRKAERVASNQEAYNDWLHRKRIERRNRLEEESSDEEMQNTLEANKATRKAATYIQPARRPATTPATGKQSPLLPSHKPPSSRPVTRVRTTEIDLGRKKSVYSWSCDQAGSDDVIGSSTKQLEHTAADYINTRQAYKRNAGNLQALRTRVQGSSVEAVRRDLILDGITFEEWLDLKQLEHDQQRRRTATVQNL